MRQFIFCFLSLLIIINPLHAQRDSVTAHHTNNSIFFEYGGNAGYRIFAPGTISVNYDNVFCSRKIFRFSGRIGFNLPINQKSLYIPVMGNVLFGKKKYFLEMGTGYEFIFWNVNYKRFGSAVTSVIGLRYQEFDKGIIVRIGVTPTFGIGRDRFYRGTSFMGISLGFTF